MNDQTDSQLLRLYVERRTEQAFAELVRRHVNFVYSAASRMVRDPHLAEDVTQGVFVALVKSAPHLLDRATLSGWLHQTAQNIAAKTVRTIERRRTREQEAAAMNQMPPSQTEASWEQIAPHLDAALSDLSEADRDAVLLRYFEKKSAREIGRLLGLSDEAAQKRVGRAVERLREFFARRGVTVGAGGLVVVISANAVQAAPVGLIAAISTAAILSGTAVSTSTVIAATKTIAMTALQKIAITAAIVAATGTGIFEARQAAQLREQNQKLQQQQVPLAGQVQQLQRERDEATNRLASMAEEIAKIKGNNLELLKLRNEMALLKSQSTPNPPSSLTGSNENGMPLTPDIGRELGMAVVRGDAGAFDRLLVAEKEELQSFTTNRVGLDQQQDGKLATLLFQPAREAFHVIGDAAATGNQSALDALTRALQIKELSGLAVDSLGNLAGNNDPGALDVLTHPEKYGVLLSSTITPLKAAADNGNQTAIDALAVVANDQSDQTLWFMTANSLSQAATAGNPVAVDALINMLSDTNRSVQNKVAQGLRGAAANHNAKAVQALNAMGLQ